MHIPVKILALAVAFFFAIGLAAPNGADAKCAVYDAPCLAKEAKKKAEEAARAAKKKAEEAARKAAEAKKKVEEAAKKAAAEAKKKAEQAAAEAKKKAEQAGAEAKRIAEEAAKAAKDFVLKVGAAVSCEATVNSIKLGKKLPGIDQFIPTLKSQSSSMASRYRDQKAKAALMDSLKRYTESYKHLFPEMNRIAAAMKRNGNQVRNIFLDSKIFCGESIAKKSQRLAALGLRPSFPQRRTGLLDGLFAGTAHAAPRFYMSYQFAVGAAAVGGVEAALSLATDYAGNGGIFVTVGPQYVTNISAGGNFGVQFFPAVDLGGFSGWGWGIGVSGGPPTKVVSAGLDFALDEKFRFQGVGPSIGVGLGLLPADVAFSFAHSWKLTGW